MAEACYPNENGGYVVERVITSKFQADALITGRFKGGLSNLIYGNDTDYFVLLGAECILMWNMKVRASRGRREKRKRKNEKNSNGDDTCTSATNLEVELCGALNETMEGYVTKLEASSSTLPKDLKWVKAQFPFFDNPDPVVRIIVAIILGCDVYDGLKGWGP